jgi:FtsH-binding integral membrane protein
MERGWDPEVKKYFRKVLNSISLGLLWMMAMVTAGLYFELAYGKGIYTIIFYVMLVASLVALLWKYYKMWKS